VPHSPRCEAQWTVARIDRQDFRPWRLSVTTIQHQAQDTPPGFPAVSGRFISTGTEVTDSDELRRRRRDVGFGGGLMMEGVLVLTGLAIWAVITATNRAKTA